MKIIIALIFIFSACSCTKNKEPRYIVIGTGDIPTFLDTETREVYSIQTYEGSAPDVYKTSLEKAIK